MSEDKKPNEMPIPADQPPSASTAPTMVTTDMTDGEWTMKVSQMLLHIIELTKERMHAHPEVRLSNVCDATKRAHGLLCGRPDVDDG